MADTTPEIFPRYKAMMRVSESKADIESIREYDENTHVEYMYTAANRWNRMLEVVRNITFPPELKDVKTLAELTYMVHRSTPVRALARKVSRRGPGHALKTVEKIGKIVKTLSQRGHVHASSQIAFP
jgi:hypothetical protein